MLKGSGCRLTRRERGRRTALSVLGRAAPAAEDVLDFWYENVWAEDIDHRAIEGAPDDHGPIIGRDAMRAYVADWYEMFPDLTIVFEGVTDAGPCRVIAVSHLAGTARASGVPTEIRVPVVWTIRDGKIVRGREYLTMDEALAAVAEESQRGSVYAVSPTDAKGPSRTVHTAAARVALLRERRRRRKLHPSSRVGRFWTAANEDGKMPASAAECVA
jgi:ketosteroid isomerase-like protein